MPVMTIVLESPAFPDLAAPDARVHHLTGPISVACLPDGMVSGRPSVAFRFDLEDGSSVLAETSLALFLSAADALRAKYGDPR